MHRFAITISLLVLPFVLVACFREEPEPLPVPAPVPEPVAEPEPAPQEVPQEHLVTHNVTYTGIVEEGGVTIYQEGSHRLMLSDGKMVLLEPAEGSDIQLDLYVGKLARAKGDVMPTVEAGGTLMQVREIEWIRRETNEEGEEGEVMRMLCGEETSCPDGYTCVPEEEVGVCVKEDAEGIEDSEESDNSEESEDDRSLASSDSSDSSESSSSNQQDEDEQDEQEEENDEGEEENEDQPEEESDAEEEEPEESERETEEEEEDVEPVAVSEDEIVQQMAEEDYAPERWVQRYCSPHLEYCVPVHRNWYFYSFGATASTISHLEMGGAPVSNFGDGPLVVDLRSGDLAAIGVQDGTVKVIGNKVIGYRSWSDNRHFEISAHASLKEPVSYITEQLSAAE